ncbi:alpha/beta fold hydrolase [Nocardia sp. NPDC003979]
MTPELWHTDHGHGIPVVLIHGYTVDHRVLLPLEAAFLQWPGFRRIYLDLPGHGHSPRAAGTTSATTVTEAVITNIRRLVGDRRFAVVGQSFGGQIARAVTAAFGDQVLGMTLLVPVVRWGADRTLPYVTALSSDDDFLAGAPIRRA